MSEKWELVTFLQNRSLGNAHLLAYCTKHGPAGPKSSYALERMNRHTLQPSPAFTGLVLVLTLLSCRAFAQDIIEKQPDFGQETAALDPIDFPRLLPTDNGYLSLSKSKGRHGSKSTYLVQEWSADLYLNYQHTYEFDSDVQPVGFHLGEDGTTYNLVVHTWNLRKKNSVVTLYQARRAMGAEPEASEIANYGVATWRDAPSKGEVAARLEGVARSGISSEPPLGYQVWIRYSPNRKYFLAYHYEFSKPGLLVNVDLFDANGQKLAAGQLPVNRGRISYDLYLNNRGEVLFLETTPTGGVSMVRYDLATRESVFLEISSSNYLRTQFQIHQLSDDEIYIANEAERDGILEGVMFAHFNFAAHEVQDITFWQLSRQFQQRYDTTVASVRGEEADWRNIDLVDFRIDAAGKKWITLEKRNYSSPGFTYDHTAVLAPDLWFGRHGTVEIGDAFILAFDRNNKFMDGNIILKSTSNHADNGLRMVGVEVYTERGNILVVHHDDAIVGTEVVLSEWHPGRPNWTDTPLRDGEIFNRIRDYTLFTPEGVLLAGFTNALGRTSALIHFKR